MTKLMHEYLMNSYKVNFTVLKLSDYRIMHACYSRSWHTTVTFQVLKSSPHLSLIAVMASWADTHTRDSPLDRQSLSRVWGVDFQL